MVRLLKMPSQAIVDTFAGAIDFYYWKGMPVARKWPIWPKRLPSGPEKVAQERFGYAMRMYAFLPRFLKDQYRNMAVSADVTARDIFVRCYLNAARL